MALEEHQDCQGEALLLVSSTYADHAIECEIQVV